MENFKKWWAFETGGLVHLPRRQCLINRDRHQHTTSKAWTVINRLSVIWKPDLTDRIKYSFFQAVVVWILPYGGTIWTLTKQMEKNLVGNYTWMLRAIMNKFWWQHPTKQQLYGHQTPITKTIKVKWTRYVGHCWRSKDELISDILQWTSSHGRAKVGKPARTYIQQLCANTGYSYEDLLEAMDSRDKWRERIREIYAVSVTLWRWWGYNGLISFNSKQKTFFSVS